MDALVGVDTAHQEEEEVAWVLEAGRKEAHRWDHHLAWPAEDSHLIVSSGLLVQ